MFLMPYADYADQIPTGVDPYVAITFDEVRFLLKCIMITGFLYLRELLVEIKFVSFLQDMGTETSPMDVE